MTAITEPALQLTHEDALQLYHDLARVRVDLIHALEGSRPVDPQGLRLLAYRLLDVAGWPDGALEEDDTLALAEEKTLTTDDTDEHG